MRAKKGLNFSQAPGAVILLVILAVVLGVGASILSGVRDTAGNAKNCTSGGTYEDCGFAANASIGALGGIRKVSEWQPTIGLTVGAALVIGVVLGAFAFVRQGE